MVKPTRVARLSESILYKRVRAACIFLAPVNDWRCSACPFRYQVRSMTVTQRAAAFTAQLQRVRGEYAI